MDIGNNTDNTVGASDLRNFLSLKEEFIDRLQKLLGRDATLHELLILSSLTGTRYTGKELHNLTKAFLYKKEHISYKKNRVKSFKLKDGRFLNVARRTVITDYLKGSTDESFSNIYKLLSGDLSSQGSSSLAIGVNSCSDVHYNSQMQVILSEFMEKFINGISKCGIPVTPFSFCNNEAYSRKQFFDFFAFGISSNEFLNKVDDITKKYRLLYIGELPKEDLEWRYTHGLLKKNYDEGIALSQFDWSCDNAEIVHPFYAYSMSRCAQELQERKLVSHISPISDGGLGGAAYDMSFYLGRGVKINLLKFVDDPLMLNGENPENFGSASGILLSMPSMASLIAIDPDEIRDVQRVLKKWDIPYLTVGSSLDDMDIVMSWSGSNVVDLPTSHLKALIENKEYDVLDNPPMVKTSFSSKSQELLEGLSLEDKLEDQWVNLLGCSDFIPINSFISQYDTIVGDFSLSSTPYFAAQAYCLDDNAIIYHGSSRNFAFREDPYMGVAMSVADNIAASACLGTSPKLLFPTLIAGDIEDHRSVSDIIEGVRCLEDISRSWDFEVADLNITNQNELSWRQAGYFSVFSVSEAEIQNIIPGNFQNQKDIVLVVGESDFELLSSKYVQYCLGQNMQVPRGFKFSEQRSNADIIIELVNNRILESALPVSEGGLAITISKACLQGKLPLGISMQAQGDCHNKSLRDLVFGEVFGTYLISCKASNYIELLNVLTQHSVPILLSGEIGGTKMEIKNSSEKISIPLTTAYNVWNQRVIV